MRKKILFSKNKVPKFILFIMMVVCWSAAFSKMIEKQTNLESVVPAFQNESLSLSDDYTSAQNEEILLSDAVSAFQTSSSQTLELTTVPKKLTKDTAHYYLQSLLNQIDPDATLYSSHSDSSYSDFYCYSPAMDETFQIESLSSNGCNLQVVFTWDKNGTCKNIYIGMPCIEYDF